MTSRLFALVLCLSLLSGARAGADDVPPPGDDHPVLRVEAGGPTAFVTALAFGPDGKTLYQGGWDKVIRVWSLDDQGKIIPARTPAYRLPVGPGLDGAINVLAVSADGAWVAAGGEGVFRGSAGFRQVGFVVPSSAMTPEMRRDEGTIYVFNTQDGTARLLRGHEGPVEALAFVPGREGQPVQLVSAARERDAAGEFHALGVRLWDVGTRQTVAKVAGLPPAVRPGLAVWRAGRSVRAALALNDGAFRVWDTEAGLQVVPFFKEKTNPAHLKTVALLPGPGPDGSARLVGAAPASYLERDHGPGGRLLSWQVLASGEVRAEPPEPGRVNAYPGALGLLSRDGRADLAAMVVELSPLPPKTSPYSYHLQVVDLREGPDYGKVLRDEPLWEGLPTRPALATSPDGKWLAVAGDESHGVRIYPVASLLARGEVKPRQVRSQGLPFRHASFVVNQNGGLALLLNRSTRKAFGGATPAPDAGRGDVVFDFRNRELSAELEGWKGSTPDVSGWGVEARWDGKRVVLTVSGAGQDPAQILLPPKTALTDYALLPPHGAVKVPLLAAATDELGQPGLALYNAKTGDLVRRYIGHSGRLDTVCFSGDGRFLVSAAEDQTVCVWALDDLDQILGKRGELRGVTVRVDQGKVVVADVEQNSPLHRGDVLDGLVEQGQVRPWAPAGQDVTPTDFYFAIFRHAPDGNVTLRRETAQGNDDVPLRVSQGADQRNPLLSLFVIGGPDGKPAGAEWIGWNPVGPYECSSRTAEQYLGWHFNTGDARKPARFVTADAHHKEYYQQGILADLIAKGTLERARGPQLKPPTLVLLLRDQKRLLAPQRAPLVVDQPEVQVLLRVEGRPLNTLEEISYRLDDEPEQRLPLQGHRDGDSFEIPLKLTRGDHRFVATARVPDAPPPYAEEHLNLRLQLPRPRVSLQGKEPPRTVRQPGFDLAALVRPGRAGEPVAVTVRHEFPGQGKPVTRTTVYENLDPDKGQDLREHLELGAGNNTIEISAVNQGAPPGPQQEAERDSVAVQVYYSPKANPPLITLDSATPGGAAQGKSLALDDRRPLPVTVPAVVLGGTIKATENLTVAEWRRDGEADAHPLAGFEKNKSASLTVKEPLTLRPGPQTFHFRARTDSSDPVDYDVKLYYHPPVPTADPPELVGPRPGNTLYGEADTVKVKVRAHLTFPEDRHPYRVAILVNNKEVAPVNPGDIDEKTGWLTAEVALAPGKSSIQVRVTNEWGTVSLSKETPAFYLRPPEILEVKRVDKGGKPVVDLEARVRSPLPLDLKAVKVEVNGEPVSGVHPRVGEPEGGVRVLVLPNVPLEAGSKVNQISVRVRNAEAECSKPGILPINTDSVLPPPVVELLEPPESKSVSDPGLRVRYRIRSASPLTSARLVQEGKVEQTINVAQAVPKDGEYELEGKLNVLLERGRNVLHLEAVNGSGRRKTDVLITYTPPPFRVVIDSVRPVGPGAKEIEVTRLRQGGVLFPEGVDRGDVELHGHVEWGDPQTAAAPENVLIRPFVNGFQQVPVRLQPAAGKALQTPFVARLVLNKEDNQVSLQASGEDSDNLASFAIDCKKPIKDQRLHLLAVSLTGANPDGLRDEVLKAVRARREDDRGDYFETSAFAWGRLYGPLVGPDVDDLHVESYLALMQQQLQQFQQFNQDAPMNDVVMIYYQGRETLDKEGKNLFQLYADPSRPAGDVPVLKAEDLVSNLAEMPGAHILMLDVESPPQAGEPARDYVASLNQHPIVPLRREDEKATLLGLVRYRWLGKNQKGSSLDKYPMITILGKAMPQGTRLEDVFKEMEKVITNSPQPLGLVPRGGVLTELPDPLRDVVINVNR